MLSDLVGKEKLVIDVRYMTTDTLALAKQSDGI